MYRKFWPGQRSRLRHALIGDFPVLASSFDEEAFLPNACSYRKILAVLDLLL